MLVIVTMMVIMAKLMVLIYSNNVTNDDDNGKVNSVDDAVVIGKVDVGNSNINNDNGKIDGVDCNSVDDDDDDDDNVDSVNDSVVICLKVDSVSHLMITMLMIVAKLIMMLSLLAKVMVMVASTVDSNVGKFVNTLDNESDRVLVDDNDRLSR